MKIANVRIRNFRSISSLDIQCSELMVFCGPNSVGKSNLLRAIEFAFRRHYSLEDATDAIPRTNIGPRTLVQIEIEFADVPEDVRQLVSPASSYIYSFRLSRKANVFKRLNGEDLDDGALDIIDNHFFVAYVPATRDLTSQDANPLQRLVQKQVYSGTTNTKISGHLSDIRQEVQRRADQILSEQSALAQAILGVESLSVSTDSIDLTDLHERLSLSVNEAAASYSLDNLGSGHQNVVLIGLFRQLAESQPGHAVLLIEEPDAHLHPPITREIADELQAASGQSQIFLTSHSTTLINHIGMGNAQYVRSSESRGTHLSSNRFTPTRSNENLLMRHGLRLSEALFSKLVVLVEGISDATLLSCLVEQRFSRRLNALDVLLVPVNGKTEFPAIASVLEQLGVDWVAILDFDAAYQDETMPIVDANKRYESVEVHGELDSWQEEMSELMNILSPVTKRGRNARRNLEAILEEIENGCPQIQYFHGSVVHKLIEATSTLSDTKAELLERELRRNRKRSYRPLLASEKIILINPDLEQGMTSKATNLPIIEQVLRTHQVIPQGAPTPANREYLSRRLHSIGGNSLIWEDLVSSIEQVGGFAKTEINACMRILFDDFLYPLEIL